MSLKSFLAFALVISFSLVTFADDAKDSAALQGTWLPAAAELGGKPFPDEIRKTIKLVVKEDKYTVTVGTKLDKGSVKLNSSAKPKRMDITSSEGPNKDKTFKAIYEIDGDTLKVCYELAGGDYPTEFKSTEENGWYLVKYKKEKAPE
jgi:uncharacterized protein (TIGR03067 family)